MNLRIFFAVGLIFLLGSESFGFHEDNYSCKSQEVNLLISISGKNRPALKLATFDSSASTNSSENGKIETFIGLYGFGKLQGQVKAISATAGTSKMLYTNLADGKQCGVGYSETGILFVADVTITGTTKRIHFTCTKNSSLADEAVECK